MEEKIEEIRISAPASVETENKDHVIAEAAGKEKKAHPHTGHRERMRHRLRTSGLDSFAPHEVIEYLLFHTQSRSDTNELAHSLIETFGSLPGVLEASFDELKSVDGVGDISATFLNFLPHLFRRYSKEKEETHDTYHTISKLSRYCRALFVGATVEQVYVMLFDNSMHILDCTLLSHGTVNSAPVMTRRIAEKALEKHASCVVIAHNHPNGLAHPSHEDMEMTNTIEQALGLFQIPLLEHLLVAGSDCVPLIYKYRGINRAEAKGDPRNIKFLRSFYGLEET